ncbi:MAG: tRNA 4-thiouridine(8) synthase ThiI [Deltaproteobacteria bacterium]|nr:tRNA 4-thiouridine(8) synthase ThiI [Deltaproteobacteria bacterium]
MHTTARKVRALGLCSGGLDSMMSGLVLRNQGIEVEWVSFETPFFNAAKARKASKMTGIPLTVRPIFNVYMQMLKNPPAGYGKYMNPCMDCHALMFRLAGEMMQEKSFDFLFSGEVLGQRPMSQNKTSLHYVEKHSGFKGYILRPLSAKNLPETIPEKDGRVDRELLLDIAGRSRKRQMKLAQQFGITDYPAPAGGCLLTDKGFSNRLRDLFAHQDDSTEEELHLLKHGRHFRLNPQTKLIVGRTQKDNENIFKYHNPAADTVIDVKDYPSPISLVPHGAEKNSILLAASICAGYSKAPKLSPVDVLIKTTEGQEVIQVIAIQPGDVRKLMIP